MTDYHTKYHALNDQNHDIESGANDPYYTFKRYALFPPPPLACDSSPLIGLSYNHSAVQIQLRDIENIWNEAYNTNDRDELAKVQKSK